MLPKEVLEGINGQIQAELSSAYLYLSMSSFCEAHNLPGMARWLRVQWEEEQEHALKLFDFVSARGGHVVLQAIDRPPDTFKSPLDVFQQVLSHEQKVTASIHKLYELALKAKDYPTQIELQWFIKEQVEEEKHANEIVEQMKMIGDSGTPLIMLDRQLGARAKS